MSSIISSVAAQAAQPIVDLVTTAFGILCAVGIKAALVHTKNVKLQGVLLRLGTFMQGAVAQVDQATVGPLKAASANGKLTLADASAARAQVVSVVKSHFGETGIEELKTITGVADVQAFLNQQVEGYVKALKTKAGV